MAWYLIRTTYNSESMAAMVKNPQDRFAIMRDVVKKCGGTLHEFYYCIGSEADAVGIVEVPDYLTFSAFLLTVGSTGRYTGCSKIHPILLAEDGPRMMKMAAEMAKVYQPPSA